MFCIKNVEIKMINVICSCKRTFTMSRSLSKTHYEVLNVKFNCSQKEIREAYLKMCKKHHPDKTKDEVTENKDFLSVNEAYNILSKTDTRRAYDESLGYKNKKITYIPCDNYYNTEDYRKAWEHSTFYHNRIDELKRDFKDDDSYYGIKGIKKISNSNMFLILITISLLSGFIQIYTIRRFHENDLKDNKIKTKRDPEELMELEDKFIELEDSYNNNKKKYLGKE